MRMDYDWCRRGENIEFDEALRLSVYWITKNNTNKKLIKNMEQIQKFIFNGIEVDFQIDKTSNVMVNATQMAKIYDKLPKDFLKNDDTKSFIEVCLRKENSPFLNVKSEEDLVTTSQKFGTFMHRVLALKFAAWLNPAFELWVYKTIDFILFDYYKQIEESLKQSANRKNRIDELKEKLFDNSDFNELEQLELQEKQASYARTKQNRNQLDMFRNVDNV